MTIKEEPIEHPCTCNSCSQCLYTRSLAINAWTTQSEWIPFDCSWNSPDSYRCYQCSYATKLLITHFKHTQTHKRKRTLPKPIKKRKCRKCKFESYSLVVLKQHLKRCHIKIETKEEKFFSCLEIEGSKWFQCTKCTHKSQILENLKSHFFIKHTQGGDTPFKCQMCPFATKWQGSFDYHLKKHGVLQQPLLKCDQCDFQTRQIVTLQNHAAKRHVEVWNFDCGHCGFKTNWKQHLKMHIINKHMSDQDTVWFKCEYCSFKTKWSSSLYTHRNSKHVQWFKCQLCPFRTKQDEKLKEHEIERHSSALKCEECEFRTGSERYLEEHVFKVSQISVMFVVCRHHQSSSLPRVVENLQPGGLLLTLRV